MVDPEDATKDINIEDFCNCIIDRGQIPMNIRKSWPVHIP
jgi:hypothetical protein